MAAGSGRHRSCASMKPFSSSPFWAPLYSSTHFTRHLSSSRTIWVLPSHWTKLNERCSENQLSCWVDSNSRMLRSKPSWMKLDWYTHHLSWGPSHLGMQLLVASKPPFTFTNHSIVAYLHPPYDTRWSMPCNSTRFGIYNHDGHLIVVPEIREKKSDSFPFILLNTWPHFWRMASILQKLITRSMQKWKHTKWKKSNSRLPISDQCSFNTVSRINDKTLFREESSPFMKL